MPLCSGQLVALHCCRGAMNSKPDRFWAARQLLCVDDRWAAGNSKRSLVQRPLLAVVSRRVASIRRTVAIA
jgi:hypothetical protein